MKLKTKKKIVVISGLVLLAFAILTVFYTPFPQLQWGLLVGFAFVYVVLIFVLIRCPYCKSRIRHLDQNYCGYCGRVIDDEEI